MIRGYIRIYFANFIIIEKPFVNVQNAFLGHSKHSTLRGVIQNIHRTAWIATYCNNYTWQYLRVSDVENSYISTWQRGTTGADVAEVSRTVASRGSASWGCPSTIKGTWTCSSQSEFLQSVCGRKRSGTRSFQIRIGININWKYYSILKL